MSYFDHVSCPQCNARFDPEKIAGGPGQPMACPSCGGALGMTDLFGIKDAFSEEEGPNLNLDDLSPESRETPVWTARGGYAPDPLQGQAPLGARTPRHRRPPKNDDPHNEEQPWDRERGHVVRRGSDDDQDGGGSALDIMRKLKK